MFVTAEYSRILHQRAVDRNFKSISSSSTRQWLEQQTQVIPLSSTYLPSTDKLHTETYPKLSLLAALLSLLAAVLSAEFIEAEIASLRKVARNDRVRKGGLRGGISVHFPVSVWPSGCQPVSRNDLRSIMGVRLTSWTLPLSGSPSTTKLSHRTGQDVAYDTRFHWSSSISSNRVVGLSPIVNLGLCRLHVTVWRQNWHANQEQRKTCWQICLELSRKKIHSGI